MTGQKRPRDAPSSSSAVHAVASVPKKTVQKKARKSSAAKSTGKSSGARTVLAPRPSPQSRATPVEAPARHNPRPARQRFRPLAYWKGERVVYGQHDPGRSGEDLVGAPFEQIVDVIVADVLE